MLNFWDVFLETPLHNLVNKSTRLNYLKVVPTGEYLLQPHSPGVTCAARLQMQAGTKERIT